MFFSFFFSSLSLISLLISLFVAGNATNGRSVRPSVGPSVPLHFFGVLELFEGRIARV